MNHALASELRSFEQETSLRILVADHDGEMRRLLRLVLRRDGHEVVEVCDAGELLELLAATLVTPLELGFDLIICEQTLPGIQGLTILAGMRARNNDTPFILISDDGQVLERAHRLDGIVLNHPLNVGAIRGAIRRSADALRG
jgi:CheY-like chemotaxis protein